MADFKNRIAAIITTELELHRDAARELRRRGEVKEVALYSDGEIQQVQVRNALAPHRPLVFLVGAQNDRRQTFVFVDALLFLLDRTTTSFAWDYERDKVTITTTDDFGGKVVSTFPWDDEVQELIRHATKVRKAQEA